MKYVRIKRAKYYFLPSGDLIKVNKVNENHNKVFVYNFTQKSNEVYELDLAFKIFSPVFRIGEVAKLLGKAPATLRRYENQGLIPRAKQYAVSPGNSQKRRLYTDRDVEYLLEFFSERRSPGRPGKYSMNGTVNVANAKKFIQAKYKER